MKYRVGDKVKIRTDLEINKVYGCGYSFIEEMDKYRGKIATITDIPFNSYLIDLDKGTWSWTEKMFEYKYEYEYKIYVNDDKITITDGVNTKEYVYDTQESISIALDDFLTLGMWRPDLGQTYYTFKDNFTTVVSNIWKNDNYDNVHYRRGLVCETEEEAKKLKDCIDESIKKFRERG